MLNMRFNRIARNEGSLRGCRLARARLTEEILADYEDLEREDIQAVLAYAARLAHVNRIERLAAWLGEQPAWMG